MSNKIPLLSKSYSAKASEDKIYRLWEKSGYFNPNQLPGRHKKPYAITIAPPNITGSLHIGHALENTLLDIVIRQKRMAGYKTLWLPGTDHAGIATQSMVEKELHKEGLSRKQLGKKEFVKRIWAWQKKYNPIILNQLKKLGCSLDWSRTRFTLDQNYQKAVKAAFNHYYQKGWIYQGKRVINWCPRCQTSLSDLELIHQETKGHLWYINYPLENKKTKKPQVIVATTRPETMLGDTAVAVHPQDKRYQKLIGQKVNLPLTKRQIPIIADSLVDPHFGTGALKVTPAHDPHDFEIAQRHQLKAIKVIDQKGQMTKEAGPDFEGLLIKQARQKVIEQLRKQGLLIKTEDYLHQVPKCSRCQSLVEPLVSQQWFLKMDQLARLALKAVKNKQVKIIPSQWQKVYLNWLKQIKDWCISRQLWWGHPIPLPGEKDVLDTWFSSALWPFAVLGWPQQTKDLKTYYPTQLISSARDILHLWITRMIFSGLELTKKPPFEKVYIHPTILTSQGQRMSRSLGTGLDPLKLIDQYGSDALRFGLVYQAMGKQEIIFSQQAIISGQRLTNKIWNASRFIFGQIKDLPLSEKFFDQLPRSINQNKLKARERTILKQLRQTSLKVNQDLERFHFGQALHCLYDFFWHDFCDKFIEASKKEPSQETKKVLLYTLLTSLKLFHPFIPFVTEAIYQKLPLKKRYLLIEKWPTKI